MDPFTALFLVSLVISVAFQVDATVASKKANDRNSNITKQATQIANNIAKDQALVNKLLVAWQNKDTQLASDLLYSSPFGTRVRKLKQAKDQAERNVEELNKEAINLQQKQSKLDSETSENQSKSSTSGSAVTDLISGTSHYDPNFTNYDSKDYSKYKIGD